MAAVVKGPKIAVESNSRVISEGRNVKLMLKRLM
jgi:hypothetical protein